MVKTTDDHGDIDYSSKSTLQNDIKNTKEAVNRTSSTKSTCSAQSVDKIAIQGCALVFTNVKNSGLTKFQSLPSSKISSRVRRQNHMPSHRPLYRERHSSHSDLATAFQFLPGHSFSKPRVAPSYPDSFGTPLTQSLRP